MVHSISEEVQNFKRRARGILGCAHLPIGGGRAQSHKIKTERVRTDQDLNANARGRTSRAHFHTQSVQTRGTIVQDFSARARSSRAQANEISRN